MHHSPPAPPPSPLPPRRPLRPAPDSSFATNFETSHWCRYAFVANSASIDGANARSSRLFTSSISSL
jgi:hypothetical protein